jgi:acyl-coenzyme A thioesterase 13
MGIVTYINSGGKVGDTLRAEVTCDKCECALRIPVHQGLTLIGKVIVGKSLAYTSIHFINSKGELAARGSHTK